MNSHLTGAQETAELADIAATHDAHAPGLYQYCWFMLGDEDAVRVALRDSLIMARAHRTRLADPAMLRPWLYTLARAECLRRRPTVAAKPATPPAAGLAAPGGRAGADPGVIAWQAVMSLGAAEGEALELSARHGMSPAELGLVLGLCARDTEMLLGRARESLRRALAGEILARCGGTDCATRAAILAGWDGTVTTQLRKRLARHAEDCADCGPLRPRTVAAAKVYALLDAGQPPPDLRTYLLDSFTDPDLAAYRAFAAGRPAAFTAAGFPLVASAPREGRDGPAGRVQPRAATAHLWVGLVAAGTATVLGLGLTLAHLAGLWGVMPGSPSLRAAAAPRSQGGSPAATSARAGWPVGGAAPPGAPVQAGPGWYAAPPLAGVPPLAGALPARRAQRGGPAAETGRLRVWPARLDLGPAGRGWLMLGADGGQVIWSASTSSAEVALGSYGGSLGRGATARITVTLARTGGEAGAGRTTVVFGPGNLAVVVAWVGAGASPSPTAAPTASGVQPSPAPSPAPSPPGPPPSASTPPSPSASTGRPPSPSASPAESPAPAATADRGRPDHPRAREWWFWLQRPPAAPGDEAWQERPTLGWPGGWLSAGPAPPGWAWPARRGPPWAGPPGKL